MEDAGQIGRWLKAERVRREWSAEEVAKRARTFAAEEGAEIKLTQQSISLFEQGTAKRVPVWMRWVRKAFEAADNETDSLQPDDHVMIERLPTFAGAGGGGTGDDDRELRAFSGSLIRELGVAPANLLLIEVEGDSMTPEFLSGDQMLVDKRRTSIAQPGAFCLWDGDGYVVKYLERVHGSEPPKVRVMSGNPRYSAFERLVEEVLIMGRIVWFGRRV